MLFLVFYWGWLLPRPKKRGKVCIPSHLTTISVWKPLM